MDLDPELSISLKKQSKNVFVTIWGPFLGLLGQNLWTCRFWDKTWGPVALNFSLNIFLKIKITLKGPLQGVEGVCHGEMGLFLTLPFSCIVNGSESDKT